MMLYIHLYSQTNALKCARFEALECMLWVARLQYIKSIQNINSNVYFWSENESVYVYFVYL